MSEARSAEPACGAGPETASAARKHSSGVSSSTTTAPLAFMEKSGRNRTPDKLPVSEREGLFEICDDALRDTVAALNPSFVIGVGRFAEGKARARAARASGFNRQGSPSQPGQPPGQPGVERGCRKRPGTMRHFPLTIQIKSAGNRPKIPGYLNSYN